MKKTILIIAALCVWNNTIAQTLQLTPVYDHCYNDTFEVGQGRMCKPLPNGNGYVIVGDSRLAVTDGKPHHGTFNSGWNEDAYIAVTDNNFNVLKSNIFGGTTANDDHDYFSDVFPQADGGYVCYGQAESTDGDIGAVNGFTGFIFKVDSNLNKVWSRPYNIATTAFGEGHCIQSRYGHFYMVGSTNGPSGDNGIDLDGNPFAFDWTIVKYDLNGNKLWAKVYGSSKDEGYEPLITEDKAGNIYLISNAFEGDNDCVSVDTTWRMAQNTNDDIFLLKLDSAGNRLWSRSYGGKNVSGYEIPVTVFYDSINNEILFGGASDGKDLMFSSAQYLADDAFFVRIDTAGIVQQVRMIGGNHQDNLRFIGLGPNPNTYFIGIATQSINDGDLTGYVAGGGDLFLCLIDQQGNFIMKFGMPNAYNNQYFNHVLYNKSKAEVILGAGFGAQAQLFCDSLIHTTNIAKPAIRRLRFDPVGMNDKYKDQLEYTIYPNPTTQLFYIKTLEKIDYEVKIVDLNGKQLTQKTKQESLAGINVAGFASGTYIVVIQTKDYKSHRKLIISP